MRKKAQKIQLRKMDNNYINERMQVAENSLSYKAQFCIVVSAYLPPVTSSSIPGAAAARFRFLH